MIKLIGNEVVAVIQAGGRGDRMRPLTDRTPKPLLKVGEIPILGRLLMHLAYYGISSTSIITGWHGNQIEKYIQKVQSNTPDMAISCVQEVQPMGNIGALPLVDTGNRPVLFLFGDLITNINLADLVQAHYTGGGGITLASHFDPYKVQFGELEVEGNKVIGYIEKPIKHTLICSGIAIFDPAAVNLIIPGEISGISELVTRSLDQGVPVSHWHHNALWIDVNNEAALEEANRVISCGDLA